MKEIPETQCSSFHKYGFSPFLELCFISCASKYFEGTAFSWLGVA